jgi:hypothetical protein
MTGDAAAEARLTAELARNGLDISGTATVKREVAEKSSLPVVEPFSRRGRSDLVSYRLRNRSYLTEQGAIDHRCRGAAGFPRDRAQH